MYILAWIILIISLLNVLLTPAIVNRQKTIKPLEAGINTIIWLLVAIFSGVYLFS